MLPYTMLSFHRRYFRFIERHTLHATKSCPIRAAITTAGVMRGTRYLLRSEQDRPLNFMMKYWGDGRIKMDWSWWTMFIAWLIISSSRSLCMVQRRAWCQENNVPGYISRYKSNILLEIYYYNKTRKTTLPKHSSVLGTHPNKKKKII